MRLIQYLLNMARMRKSKQESPEDREARETMERLRCIASEHFDCGVVIMSREMDGRTEYYHSQIGNTFALRGMIEAYMEGAFGEE